MNSEKCKIPIYLMLSIAFITYFIFIEILTLLLENACFGIVQVPRTVVRGARVSGRLRLVVRYFFLILSRCSDCNTGGLVSAFELIFFVYGLYLYIIHCFDYMLMYVYYDLITCLVYEPYGLMP